MTELPIDWSEQLQAVYPKRSGPSGWKGMRLMLALRRALLDSTWEQILDGCKNYAKYCQESGSEGSSFVQAPQRFIEDGSFLEEFTHQAAVDPKVAEQKRREAERFTRAVEAGSLLGLEPLRGECAASFETRIAMHRNSGPTDGPRGDVSSEIRDRIASLAGRMRIAK